MGREVIGDTGDIRIPEYTDINRDRAIWRSAPPATRKAQASWKARIPWIAHVPWKTSALFAAVALAVLSPADGARAQIIESVPIGTFKDPVYVAAAPGKPNLLFVVERAGRIIALRKEVKLKRAFLNIRKLVRGLPDKSAVGEQGLFSVAFAPDFKTSRLFYVGYTNRDGNIEIDEFKVSKKRATKVVENSRRKVLIIKHKELGHYGGQLQFGPDRKLYISTGDGGDVTPLGEPARKLNNMLGKILRIDPRKNDKRAYRVPRSNPFVAKAGRNEIYAYGLRNPWRFSFQGETLLVSDVGQGDREEVNILKRKAASGVNFGWPEYEGDLVFASTRPGPHPARPPEFVYDHTSNKCSITGGYVMDDSTIPALAGRYIYGDFCTGDIRTINPGSGATDDTTTGLTLAGITSFGKGFKGQVYAAQINGTVSRLEAK